MKREQAKQLIKAALTVMAKEKFLDVTDPKNVPKGCVCSQHNVALKEIVKGLLDSGASKIEMRVYEDAELGPKAVPPQFTDELHVTFKKGDPGKALEFIFSKSHPDEFHVLGPYKYRLWWD
jgi:hypothetical protein